MCDRVPGIVLEKFATIPYTEEDKEGDRRRNEAVKAIEAMTEAQRDQFIAQWKNR